MQALKDLFQLLGSRDRKRLAVIMVGLAVAAIIEVLGVASVIPFLTLVGDPAAAERVPYLAGIRNWLGLADERTFLLVTGGQPSVPS